jgi:hypothetical protein
VVNSCLPVLKWRQWKELLQRTKYWKSRSINEYRLCTDLSSQSNSGCIFELVCYIKSHFGELDQNIAVHNHNTCQKLNLHVQFCRTNVSKNGVMIMEIKLYNKIRNKIREVGKMRQFKRVFRSYLVQHVFYSVEEYMLRLL